jgi:hypothetical protein
MPLYANVGRPTVNETVIVFPLRFFATSSVAGSMECYSAAWGLRVRVRNVMYVMGVSCSSGASTVSPGAATGTSGRYVRSPATHEARGERDRWRMSPIVRRGHPQPDDSQRYCKADGDDRESGPGHRSSKFDRLLAVRAADVAQGRSS